MGRRMTMRRSPAKIDHQVRGEQAEEGGRRTTRGLGRGCPCCISPTLPLLGDLPAPTILQREAKQAPARPLKRATPTKATSGATASGDANLPPPRVAATGDEAEVEAETLVREEHHLHLQIREASAPSSSRCDLKLSVSPSEDENMFVQENVTRACPICLGQSTCNFPIILSPALSPACTVVMFRS